MKLVDDLLSYCAAFGYLLVSEMSPQARSLILLAIILSLGAIALAALQDVI